MLDEHHSAQSVDSVFQRSCSRQIRHHTASTPDSWLTKWSSSVSSCPTGCLRSICPGTSISRMPGCAARSRTQGMSAVSNVTASPSSRQCHAAVAALPLATPAASRPPHGLRARFSTSCPAPAAPPRAAAATPRRRNSGCRRRSCRLLPPKFLPPQALLKLRSKCLPNILLLAGELPVSSPLLLAATYRPAERQDTGEPKT